MALPLSCLQRLLCGSAPILFTALAVRHGPYPVYSTCCVALPLSCLQRLLCRARIHLACFNPARSWSWSSRGTSEGTALVVHRIVTGGSSLLFPKFRLSGSRLCCGLMRLQPPGSGKLLVCQGLDTRLRTGCNLAVLVNTASGPLPLFGPDILAFPTGSAKVLLFERAMGCGASKATILSEAPVSSNPDEFFAYQGTGPWHACRADSVIPARLAKSGAASKNQCPPATLQELLKKAAEEKGDKPAMKVERPLPALLSDGSAPPVLEDGQWKVWTYKQYYDESRKAARSFVKLGFEARLRNS